jgi:hypothetical protein
VSDSRNWIVITGSILNTAQGGGGLEFFGPYTEDQAVRLQRLLASPSCELVLAVQLLHRRVPK